MAENANEYLAREKVGKLIMKFSVPAVASMLVSSLYNMVDQVFIGRGVGMYGNGATNVVYPATVIALAIALLMGDGAAAFVSICQGKKDFKSANRTVGNVIGLSILVSLVLCGIFLSLKEPLLRLFGATEMNLPFARDYYGIIVIGLPFFMFGCVLNGLIRADGSPKFAMITNLLGCAINLVFDPIAIFVLNWGMKGAAIATIAGQIISALCGIWYLFHMKSVKLDKSCFIPDGSTIRQFLTMGLSSFLTQLSIVAIMVIINNILITFGAASKYGPDIPLTVIGIVSKITGLVIAFVVGIAGGCQPIVGYNFGAKEYDRVKQIYRTMMLLEGIIAFVTMVLCELFPIQIVSIFGKQGDLYNEFANFALRIQMITIVFCAIAKSSAIFLQSIGRPVMATSVSVVRDFALSVVLQLTLPRIFGVVGVLWAVPIIDTVALLMVIVFIRKVFGEFDKAGAA